MITYCDKCKKPCGLFVSQGPMEYSTEEAWGVVQTVPIGREIVVLSDCHLAFVNDENGDEVDPYRLPIEVLED